MRDLSVIVPARNELFLAKTVEDVIEHAQANTEIIAVCDGYWPNPEIADHDDVVVVHHTCSIGQRAALNEAARMSRAKYIMTLDAHCSLTDGFDVRLIEDCEYDWIMVPSMCPLRAFDWRCKECGYLTDQGAKPTICNGCNQLTDCELIVIWEPQHEQQTYRWRFDKNLNFEYWHESVDNDELVETLTATGACMFLFRDRYWDLGGFDERYGRGRQLGTEMACKTWLSGGRLITTKKACFSHLFRGETFRQNGNWPRPYFITQEEIDRATQYSKELWIHNSWPGASYSFQWLLDRFAPVPGWHDE